VTFKDTPENGATRALGELDSELVLAQLRRLEEMVADSHKPPPVLQAWLALAVALLSVGGSVFGAGVAWSRVAQAEATVGRLEALVLRVESQAAANRALLERLDERSRQGARP